ncbi:protein eva-1 isoform X3 [Stomoxys calcitrans]|uniref:protein eva-1 isoform X3 n=1 Tax=Stomoxys calcitrans TaxID=35570 RepID=UPI0027E2D174|nr:protein eva-1 isoform X3 [Stomoxys calcitrans]
MATLQQPGQKLGHWLLHHSWRHVLCAWLTFWVFFMCTLNPVLPEVIYRVDPLALLAATLRTYQRAGCDSEQLSLSCPRGTSISIELAQYGRAGDLSDHSLCPPLSQEDLTTTGSSSGDGNAGLIGTGSNTGVIHSGTQIEVKPPESCTVSGLQYALLQTVVDACQKKRHCKFSANSKPLASGDPCAGIRKFVEIAYKCRPYEFRSKVACENDNMPLVCNPYSRIAIYSASFGYIERESVQCPQNSSTQSQTQTTPDTTGKQTCLVSYATETVMQICHGRRRCSVTADAGTFGRPCKNDIPMHLKVVYTCIPRKVLKDRYETAPEPDEPQQSELDLDQDELYDEDQFYKEGEAIPPAPKLQGAIPNAAYPFDFNMRSNEPTTTMTTHILSHNDNTLEENQEQFYLYLIISVAAGMLLCLTLVIGRLTLQRRRSCRKSSLSSTTNNEKNLSDKLGNSGGGGDNTKYQHETTRETQLNSSFGDDISDIDADIDLTSPMPASNISNRNESYMTYAPIPNCAYGSLGDHSSTNYGTPTTMLMPSTSQHNSLMMAGGHGGISSIGMSSACPNVVGSRQTTPPPPSSAALYTSMGVCSPSVSGTLTMGPHIMSPSILSNTGNQNMGGPSYLSGTIMVPGHHHSHTATLRRSIIPTSMGIMGAPSPPLVAGNPMPPAMVGVPTSSSVYYDTTIPRHLSRGMSADSNPQYFYG